MSASSTRPIAHRDERAADGARQDLAAALADCARVVRNAHEALAAHALVVQCAWCTRYLVGGHALAASELPCHLDAARLWHEGRVTHGVCDACVAAIAPAAT